MHYIAVHNEPIEEAIMASKTPAEAKPLKAESVAVDLPAAAVVADAPPAFVPTQAVTKKPAAPDVVAPFAAAPIAAKPAKIAKSRPVAAPAPAPVAKKRVAPKAAPDVATITAVKPSVPPVIMTPAAPVEEKKMETPFTNAGATQFADKAKTMFAEAGTKSQQAFADINDFGKGNIEALVESSKIAVKGVEAFGQDTADYGRRQIESATAALKSLSSVKSPTDFFKLQSDYIRASFDSLVAQTSKNTETMLKLAGEVAQPIQNRVAVAVEKAKVAA